MNALLKRSEARQPPQMRPAVGYPYAHWSALERALVVWAGAHWPEPLDAMWLHIDNGDYVRRCMGAIFRRAAQADPTYLLRCAERVPDQLLALSPYIRSVGDVPGRDGWRKWIETSRNAELVAWWNRKDRA